MLLTVFLVSCIGNNQNKVTRSDVIAYMDEYFEIVKENDFKLVESFYSETFYQSTSKEKWEKMFYKVHSVIGTLISVNLQSWNMRSVLSTSGSGKTYTFIYKNKYENGEVTETINLFIPRGTKDIGIVGHNFNSDAFLNSPGVDTDGLMTIDII